MCVGSVDTECLDVMTHHLMYMCYVYLHNYVHLYVCVMYECVCMCMCGVCDYRLWKIIEIWHLCNHSGSSSAMRSSLVCRTSHLQ